MMKFLVKEFVKLTNTRFHRRALGERSVIWLSVTVRGKAFRESCVPDCTTKLRARRMAFCDFDERTRWKPSRISAFDHYRRAKYCALRLSCHSFGLVICKVRLG